MNSLFTSYSIVENTRMIFDFMQELDRRCIKTNNLRYLGEGGLKKRFETVKQLSFEIKNLIESSNAETGDNDFLYQNPLTQYIKFWNMMYADYLISLDKSNNKYENILANMLNYFRCIKSLDNMTKSNIKNDDLPYIYEDICLSFCEITECDMSYIFCQDAENRIQTVMSSSYIVDEDVDCQNIDADKIISEVCNKKNEKLDGIYFQNNKNTKIVISIPEHYYQNATNRMFYIVLQYNKSFNDSECVLKIISKVLFLRDKLLTLLKRDFAVLLNLRFDSSYIKPINVEPINNLFVLHISDLHITENKKWEVDSKNVKRIVDKIKQSPDCQNVELIAITGDIVQGSNNANSAQEKYRKAEAFIYKIATELWAVKNDKQENTHFRLSHDWKRRILITTGNHDYAAMNDVVVQTKSRVIRSATPSKSQAGTMSKFTYYIEFMQHFLDAPIDKLINDDLNEVKFFRNLNLNVFILNSVSLANSLQNNKVGFNEEKVNALLEFFLRKESNNTRRICLAHHSPEYKISYIMDIYTPYNLFKMENDANDILNRLYKCFSDCIDMIEVHNSVDIKASSANAFQKEFADFDEKITSYQRGTDEKDEMKSIVEKAINKKAEESKQDVGFKEIDAWIRNFCESDLYCDMRELYNYIINKNENEFSLQLLNKLYNIHKMQLCDKVNFEKVFKSILENTTSVPIQAVLAGHEHARNNNDVRKYNVPIYIEGTVDKGFSIISINKSGYTQRTNH